MSRPAWRRSWLHPEALYLSEGAAFRSPDPLLLDGVRRLRAVLPDGAEPPLGWVRSKSTVLRRVACLRLCATLVPAPGGVRIGPITRGDPDWRRWLSLHHRRYRATHSDNPPRSLAPRDRAAIFAGDDLMLALGLWRDGLLTGFASLRQSEAAGVTELGWIGAEGRAPTRACGWLLHRCAEEARRLGRLWMDLEIDSTDSQLAPLLAALPPGRQQVFLTWTRELGDSS